MADRHDAPSTTVYAVVDTTSAASGLRVKLTTHKVVIDANDEAHAADLYERLHNDGFRVHRETHKLVQDDLGYMSTEVERVG